MQVLSPPLVSQPAESRLFLFSSYLDLTKCSGQPKVSHQRGTDGSLLVPTPCLSPLCPRPHTSSLLASPARTQPPSHPLPPSDSPCPSTQCFHCSVREAWPLYPLVPTFSLLINPLGCLLTALGAPSLTEPWLALALAIPLHLTVLMSSVSESPPPLTPLPGLRVLPEVAYSLSDKPRRQIWK